MNLTIFVIFFQGTLLLAHPSNRSTLKFSQVIFRHGDRNPRYVYGNYVNNTKVFPEGLENLTNLGKKHAFELGQFLRRRYDGFMSPSYKMGEISMYSSQVDRCIKTASSCLQGLFQDYSDAALRSNYQAEHSPYEPIPIRVIPTEDDNFFSLNSNCPVRALLTTVPFRTFFVKRHFQDEPEILEYIFRQSGETALFDHPQNSLKIYEVFEKIQEVIHCLAYAGKPLEDWMKPILHKEIFLSYPYFLQLAVHIDGLQVQRLNAGPMVQWILENYAGHLNGTLDKKVVFFSAHDSTIVNVMNAFDILPILNSRIPPFASAILMELHELPEYDEPVIEFWYRNSTTQTLDMVNSPSCGVPCTLGNLIKITSRLVNIDYETECNASFN